MAEDDMGIRNGLKYTLERTFLNTFEESVIIGITRTSLLIGMVL